MEKHVHLIPTATSNQDITGPSNDVDTETVNSSASIFKRLLKKIKETKPPQEDECHNNNNIKESPTDGNDRDTSDGEEDDQEDENINKDEDEAAEELLRQEMYCRTSHPLGILAHGSAGHHRRHGPGLIDAKGDKRRRIENTKVRTGDELIGVKVNTTNEIHTSATNNNSNKGNKGNNNMDATLALFVFNPSAISSLSRAPNKGPTGNTSPMNGEGDLFRGNTSSGRNDVSDISDVKRIRLNGIISKCKHRSERGTIDQSRRKINNNNKSIENACSLNSSTSARDVLLQRILESTKASIEISASVQETSLSQSLGVEEESLEVTKGNTLSVTIGESSVELIDTEEGPTDRQQQYSHITANIHGGMTVLRDPSASHLSATCTHNNGTEMDAVVTVSSHTVDYTTAAKQKPVEEIDSWDDF